MQPDGTLIVNKSKSDLKSAPSLRKNYSNLEEPYTITIYEFYAVPVSAAGAAGSPSGESQGVGSNATNNTTRTTSTPRIAPMNSANP